MFHYFIWLDALSVIGDFLSCDSLNPKKKQITLRSPIVMSEVRASSNCNSLKTHLNSPNLKALHLTGVHKGGMHDALSWTLRISTAYWRAYWDTRLLLGNSRYTLIAEQYHKQHSKTGERKFTTTNTETQIRTFAGLIDGPRIDGAI